MPPNAECAERLARGEVEPTVLCYHRDSPENATVRTVAEIRGSRKSAKNRAPVEPLLVAKTSTVDAARQDVQPQMRHDFNS